MTTSLITFENNFRERLLDVIYGQWRRLGAPFSDAISNATEVIDPEALLWCSLEFIPSEPRLFESVLEWLHVHKTALLRQRLKKRAASADPRALLWNALEKEAWPGALKAAELPHGLESAEAFEAFFDQLRRKINRASAADTRIGARSDGPSTLLLRARDLLGGDVRHFLLLYLLASPRGGRLRSVQAWSGYTYRGISEVATRWQSAGTVVVEHGYCHLTDPEPWRALLHHRTEPLILVHWFDIFDECIRLLRALTKARRKGFAWENPVLVAHRRDALNALSSPLVDRLQGSAASLSGLKQLLAPEQHALATA